MRFAIYARKSTESEDRQIQSLEDQIRELTALARREGYIVTAVFQESRSAKAPENRPEFDRLLKDIEQGEFDGVLTWSMNRLSRNPVDGGRVAYLLQTGRLSVIRTIERTYRPDDNALLLSIENGMATAYIQDLSRNVKRGMQGKFERGWQNCKAPLGYRNDAESRETVPDPERFVLVRSAWTKLASGDCSTREVVRYLQQRGLTVLSRHGERKPVATSTLYNMFRNPFYCGRIRFNDLEKTGRHQAMVTEEEFAKVQNLLDTKCRPSSQRRLQFPYQGVLRCADCGCSVLGERKWKTYPRTGRTVEYVYYHCSGSKGCSKAGIRQEDLTKICEDFVRCLRITPAFDRWLRRTSAAVLERRIIEDTGLESLKADIAQAQQRLDALVTMRADGEIGQAEFARSRSQALSRMKQLKGLETSSLLKPSLVLDRLDAVLKAAGNQRAASCATLLKVLGGGTFRPGEVRFKVEPVVQKIATLELAYSGSRTAINGNLPPVGSFWWREVEGLLNLIEDTLVQ